MDVSCPRCKTEYEFDDARVPEGGVTVKCTNCSYVFRVKRSEGAVLVPGVELPRPPPTQPDPLLPPPSSMGPREWKVRQPSGNVFSFKELTTLQKWIVERKVARADEISLTGETWKRLGDIPELASFFIVVDEALRAAKLEAAKDGPVPPPSGPGAPMPQVSQPVWLDAPAPAPRASAPPAPKVSDSGQFPVQRIPRHLDEEQATDETLRDPGYAFRPGVDPAAAAPKNKVLETLKEPMFSSPAVSPQKPVSIELDGPRPAPPRPSAPPRVSAPRHPPPPRQLSANIANDWEAPVVRRSSGGGGWFFFLIVAAMVGGGAGYYFAIYLPEKAHADEERAVEAQQKAAEDKVKEEAEAKAKALADEKAKKEQEALAAAEAAKADAGPKVAAPVAAVVDAGAPAVVAANTPPPAPVKHDFDWYVQQGDKFRDREKADKALEMYGQAADMDPERVEPLAGRGLALLDMGRALQAEAALQQALKVNSRYAPAIMGLAETYRVLKKDAQAVEWYQKYLDVLPNGSEANVARSNIERLKPKSAPAATPEPSPSPGTPEIQSP